MAHIRYLSNLELNNSITGKFPVIIAHNLKVHRLSLKYLLELRPGCSGSTLKTYAQHLVDFFCQIEVDNEGLEEGDAEYTAWDEIDDHWIESYANALEGRVGRDKENTANYVGQVLSSVIRYLQWTERNGFTSFLIGDGDNYRIQLPSGRNSSHPIVKKFLGTKPPSKTAPRKEWIETVKANVHIEDKSAAFRFELMVDWALEAGLRAHEVCALKIEQLPDSETAQKAIIDEKNVFINIVISKGSKPKVLPISPLLVKKTWDFIESERESILKAMRSKAKRERLSFDDSGVIFPSSTTGKALTPTVFSNQMRKAFLKAVENGDLTKDERVWAHGLRHRYTTDTIKGLDERGVKNPERITKQLSRHEHEDSLEGYTVSRHFEEDHG